MADEPTDATDQPKKKRFYHRFWPTTIAGKSACLASFALWALWFTIWMVRLFGDESVRVAHSISFVHGATEVLLAILIPVVLYFGIRRWNRVIEGEFPDIDRAWEAGIAALQAKGISPRDYPIFLILGSSDEGDEHGLMEALDSPLLIHGVPESNGVSHALKWYLTSDALYLFCTGASSLSVLMGRMRASKLSRVSVRPLPRASSTLAQTELPQQEASTPTSTIGGPMANAEAAPAATPASNSSTSTSQSPDRSASQFPVDAQPAPVMATTKPDADDQHQYLGTIGQHTISGLNQPQSVTKVTTSSAAFGMQKSPQTNAPGSSLLPPPTSHSSAASVASRSLTNGNQGTLMIDQASVAAIAEQPPTTARVAPPTATRTFDNSATKTDETKGPTTIKPAHMSMPQVSANKKIALPENLDTSDQLPRLTYVCKLLRRYRRPVCGINGAVTLLPFELSQVGPLQLAAIAQSARNDVTTVQKTLGVRTPVTALLVGLEREAGFIELVRRLGADLLSRRLGGRFDLRSRPTPNELNTHSDRLCDAFEDWVHRLFSRDDGLEQQRGNRKLYSLTCRIRHELKPRLRIVLGQAFGCDSSDSTPSPQTDESFFFSGCYFAASGAETGRPAFVKGVLQDKLIDEQSNVQWTHESVANHRYFRMVCFTGWCIVIILLMLLLMQLSIG
ncbi:type VI secretion protein IcmF/TssM N-terminal domain-containing protein [Roseiconus lacunae]|uniref:Type VI secretion protein IcmF/TssM N-terminal domain-containing protein n=1 Tax=Roseiconus lacunae TaxID=2605694 RepID=A0ABT7PER7_9BACT|nr:type VI secretion protein IcmF/TssM N-terminal domain-containing protein [Roseiconus lacunae]MDM4014716.1 type VI secretion protein IcmF/TssM N-terminal domain-containing protein [Roseiconus lacunae]